MEMNIAFHCESMASTTIILVSWNSYDYIEPLIRNLCQKAADASQLQFLIVDNTNGQDKNVHKLKELPCHVDIHLFSPGKLTSSRGHAAGLNYAMAQLNTEYGLVCDPDIYVFMQNWDTVLPNRLKTTNSVAIGAPYPQWKTGKYHHFPSPPFCYFHVETLRQFSTDWAPFSDSKAGHIGKFLCRQVGRLGIVITRDRYQKYQFLRQYSTWAENTLGIFAPDTGWKIAQSLKQNNASSIVFDAVLPDDSRLERFTPKETWVEIARQFELFCDGDQPFIVHKYGTRGRLWKTEKGNDKAYWLTCIETVEQT
jgi:hypothetical protein